MPERFPASSLGWNLASCGLQAKEQPLEYLPPVGSPRHGPPASRPRREESRILLALVLSLPGPGTPVTAPMDRPAYCSVPVPSAARSRTPAAHQPKAPFAGTPTRANSVLLVSGIARGRAFCMRVGDAPWGGHT